METLRSRSAFLARELTNKTAINRVMKRKGRRNGRRAVCAYHEAVDLRGTPNFGQDLHGNVKVPGGGTRTGEQRHQRSNDTS